MFLAERLDFDINAGGKLKFHQRVHGLLRGLENVEQALVGTNFKLFARLLVHVGRTQHAILVLHRRQRNRSRDLRSGAPCRVHDFARGLVKNSIIVGLQADADSFFTNHVSFSLVSKTRFEGSSAFPPSALRLLPRLSNWVRSTIPAPGIKTLTLGAPPLSPFFGDR